MKWPTTKDELVEGIREKHQQLEKLLIGFTEKEMVARNTPGVWSVKDIMAHITAWEQSLLDWYQTGLRGVKQNMPDWQESGVVDGINEKIYRHNLDRPLSEVKKDFRTSFEQISSVVEAVSEEAMFTPGKYSWTGKDTLAQYIVVNTSRHYAEHFSALEAIRQRYGK